MPARRLPASLAALLALGAAGAALAVRPAPAAAATLGTVACGENGAFLCDAFAVPIARDDATPGTISIAVTRRPAGAAPTGEAVVALAGGPGQPARPFASSFARGLAPLLTTRDLLVIDQRGTGDSGPLRCLSYSGGGPSSAADVTSCARELGAARGSYRSVDSARDLEALRVAGGYDKLLIYGVSYGTKVALTYASLFPARVSGLVLDSVVAADGPDAFSRPSFAALGRVLRELCAGSACRGASSTPAADLRRLAAQLAANPLTGTINGPDGRPIRATMGDSGLWGILLGGDLNPALRAEFPGAVRAALRGDRVPILRLFARSRGLSGTAGLQSSSEVNDVLFTATRCEETAFPWSASAKASTRLAQAREALRSEPASAFAPFTASTALDASVATICSGWPAAGVPAPALGPLPDVPTLVLDGAADLRTPVEEARRAVRGIPSAIVEPIASTGHSVLGGDLSGCADDIIAAFAAGGRAACTPARNPLSPTPAPPRRLASVAGASRPLRTVRAVRLTLDDVRRQLIGDAIAAGRSVSAGSRTGGLRSGVATVAVGVVRLNRVIYVPGVTVSGSLSLRSGGTSRFTISGSAAARGTLTIDGTGTATGRLGDRRVASRATAAGRSARLGAGGPLALPAVPAPGLRVP